MTMGRHPLNNRLLRWAVALYPASYGAGARAEVADHAERHIAHAGRLSGLREVAGVAGHGARVRFGLTSHRPLGRAFATVAPFAAVLAGTYALLLAWQAVQLATDPDFFALSDTGARKNGPLVATAALVAGPVLMAGAVLADRWSAARTLAAATVVATPLIHLLARPDLLGMSANAETSFGLSRLDLALLVLNAALLLPAPPDRTHPRSTAPRAVAIAIVTASVAVDLTLPFGENNALTGFDLLAPAATGAAIACTARTAGRAALATVLLSAPPLLTRALTSSHPSVPMLQRVVVLYAFGYVIAFGVVRLTDRLSHRAGLSRP
ncbi:hypothetical protein EH183_41885 [Streptomyces sp. CB01881]|uniref:hypothetical protein n=1 Tax=Streptomyces sp. CB01881 TaxID=2078691 RepID=UPI0011DF75AC|nr:hypothetical protein [Streptomyces sp. CB01881]TYC66548.1 hypothetical protein EH183_41885 [Streptomyces sp. CB01881]